MGPFPIQRATDPGNPSGEPQGADAPPSVRISLESDPVAPAEARRLVRAALAEWAALGLLGACAFCGTRAGGEPPPPGPGGGEDAAGCAPGAHSTDLLADDAALVADELVTNAVVHAGTSVEVRCRLHERATAGTPGTGGAAAQSDGAAAQSDGGPHGADEELVGLLVEVSDHHPSRAPADPGTPYGQAGGQAPEYGRGLQIVASLAECWGVTYRTGLKTVWARIPLDGAGALGRPPVRADEEAAGAVRGSARDEADWRGHGALSFLAETSDLLAGQLDEELVAALAGQLLVPRLADWCAVWLDGAGTAPRLAGAWHADESRLDALRAALEKNPPGPGDPPYPGVTEMRGPAADGDPGVALACRLVTNGRPVGTLVLGRPGKAAVSDAIVTLVEDFARRVALAIGAARRYTRQATISRVLQRGLLPSQVARIPGVASGLVYEPSDEGLAGGDFYDVFHCPGDRWCFMLGDVQGSGPEAAVVTGLARPWLRLLGREGYRVGEVLDRLNRLLLDDATEAAEAASALAAVSAAETMAAGEAVAAGLPVAGASDGYHPRFLSLLYGELVPLPVGGKGGGARCTLASAGHPLPLLLRPDGTVRQAAEPQLLLGIAENSPYQSHTFDLEPGDTLLCVTDGVTERRSGGRMLDDGDGLAHALASCVGLSAERVAGRIRSVVHDFDGAPPDDDLALLVFQAE
ncbi:SpoIIE family protein phosphatase [Streptomyces sp. NRRL F-5126]|uniref:SpoIIE family protein phosphatase n=1 Tax=Streptomyces sp. NRRL F-5126 TaxID=1463857 RepID=UPI0004C870DB|nr:SpoIIE family protein phosphatase [Streptomyces sp. NRRL F-5126]